MSKKEILQIIERLPDHADAADVMEELYFVQQVQRGLKDASEGRILTHTDLKKRIARWRRSAGR